MDLTLFDNFDGFIFDLKAVRALREFFATY